MAVLDISKSLPNKITSVGADALSIALAATRRAIQRRTLNRNFIFLKTPTYQQLRDKELIELQPVRNFSEDSSLRGPNPPEINNPSQRIDRSLIIKDLDDPNLAELKIQFVPKVLEYNIESKFIALASMARNNPLYQYTGSEDTLEFELDWYAEDDNRQDVITKCKFLESLTKNDSFEKPPHRIKLIWGNSLFSAANWLVVSAPYKLSMFQAHKNMMPQQAYQVVSLKRITNSNSSINQIKGLFF